ncbi:MAG: UDP-N-acetylglucosamine 1-carboxyvinyltransferase [Anaerovoracaceae bacterium]
MAKFLVEKSGPLKGEVTISGSKNAVLPIMAASLLSDEECIIYDAPDLRDVDVMCKILESLGSKVNPDFGSNAISLNAEKITSNETPQELVRRMRASILTMGPLLARFGSARVPLPGGCAIGARPIDLHLKGFESMGAEIERGIGYVEAKATKLHGARIYLDFPSVGATENIMTAAAMAEGVTIIENGAKEPEIVDLANFLNQMGGKVRGAGTDTIKIEGVPHMHGTNHIVIPDRIETGTFMVAAAITHGDVLIKNVVPDHVRPIIAKLSECGCTVEDTVDGLRVKADDCEMIATDIKTMPYPGFPTDMQSQFMALLTTVKGTSSVIETVFENRYMHINELNRMGAGIRIEGRQAIIPGNTKLVGTHVVSTDLRAGAALVIAALAAEGTTQISEIYHIERGYSEFVDKLKKIGANIRRVED